MKRHLSFPLIAVFILSLSENVCAATYGGVDFPSGIASFVDEVVIYSPVISQVGDPSAPYRVPEKAIGAPDFDDNDTNGIDYVSLGRGGTIVLRFTNNAPTGSGNSANDLWIFEIGPAVEDTFVAISKDNITWTSVGKVTGGTRGIDIDAFGFGLSDYFSYVRLIDDPNEGSISGNTVGADIDAVGAISSAAPVPIPGAVWLLGTGVLGLLGYRKKFHQ